jgi:preprotein translocase SecE subunit
MGTAIGIAILAVFTAYNIFIDLPSLLPAPQIDPTLPLTKQADLANSTQALHFRIALGMAVAVLLGISLVGFWISNKPSNVEFLIATDSEMKKVNWTSRRDLIASTKIVIIFMFAVCIFLFAVDLLFNFLFYHMHVLKSSGI